MINRPLCNLRGPNSKYCKRWCLLRCDTSSRIKKNNVLSKNGSNMSSKMRFAYNIRGNLKRAGRTIEKGKKYIYSVKSRIFIETFAAPTNKVRIMQDAAASNINGLIDNFLARQRSLLSRSELLNSNNRVNPTIVELYDDATGKNLLYTLKLSPGGVVFKTVGAATFWDSTLLNSYDKIGTIPYRLRIGVDPSIL